MRTSLTIPGTLGALIAPLCRMSISSEAEDWVLDALEGLYLKRILNEIEHGNAAEKLTPLMG